MDGHRGPMTNYDFAGKTVVVTGASMGIGEVFVRELDKRGATVVLVARSRDRLDAIKSQLERAHVIAEDLNASGAGERIFAEVTRLGLDVDVLINNAGFATHGRFSETPLQKQLDEVDLNVRALVELTYLFLPMIERKKGGVIQVASTAAFQPVPYMAIYGATKAFVLSFSEALWAEYRGREVRVLALCPGATDTPFFAKAGEQAAFGSKAQPEDVVRLGLDAFAKNRPSVVHGLSNWLTANSSRFTTRSFAAKLSAKLMAPKNQAALPARTSS